MFWNWGGISENVCPNISSFIVVLLTDVKNVKSQLLLPSLFLNKEIRASSKTMLSTMSGFLNREEKRICASTDLIFIKLSSANSFGFLITTSVMWITGDGKSFNEKEING